VVDKIKGWTYFASIDLTAATDRFPIQFIKFVLSPILPKPWLDAWEYVMVGLPFEFRRSKEPLQVAYSVGTPMGAYTS